MFNKENHPLNNLKFLDDKSKWKTENIVMTENKLEIFGHPVMESWEEPYMKKLAEIATSKNGKILEVGFGLGISAKHIQQNIISEHHIIEANNFVYEKLLIFAENANHRVFSYLGFWEDIVKNMQDESFDGILFDTYPIVESELHTARFDFFNQAYRLLKKGGVFTHYSGEIEFTTEYISNLKNAGFTDFSGELITITPSSNCLYWDEKQILAPKIIKT